MSDSVPSPGRSLATLVVMLIAFAVFAAFFVAIDAASGVHVHLLLVAAGSTSTPAATADLYRPSTRAHAMRTHAAVAGGAPAVATTTATAASAAAATPGVATSSLPGTRGAAALSPAGGTATPMPTPGGVTPPRYGTLPNYANNTSFSPALMQRLDEQIIAVTNQRRTAQGLAALAESAALDVIAAARSQDMLQRHYFAHFDPTGPVGSNGHHAAAVQELLARNNIGYTEVGENLIANVNIPLDAATPRQAVHAWMHHREHRANILYAGFTAIGVGMAAENEPDGLHVVITQIFLR